MTDARIDAFYEKAETWKEELAALRAILKASPVTEEFKWRGPCYTAHGGNVCFVGGFRDNCVLSFFKGVLLPDPENILSLPGENSRIGRVVRFTSLEEIRRLEPVLKSYIREAVKLEEEGRKVDLPPAEPEPPEELTRRLEKDEELRAAFDALTPGRQRGWILHFAQPVRPETREGRIEKARPRILKGKGMHDR